MMIMMRRSLGLLFHVSNREFALRSKRDALNNELAVHQVLVVRPGVPLKLEQEASRITPEMSSPNLPRLVINNSSCSDAGKVRSPNVQLSLPSEACEWANKAHS